ncbi:MAG: MBL fold metallo-hydrolase [Planctomycetes bacterium]|nr:MBL fold metallo-hydrolase [Planctomycetota bacterium]
MRVMCCYCFAILVTIAAHASGLHGQVPKAKDARPELEIRILFDNTTAHKELLRSWGFSALIDFRGKRILFDSGSDPVLLLEHMDKMKIDPKSIDEAFISHVHGDHRRGIYWVFEKNPAMKVHFLDSFGPEAYRDADLVKMKPNRVKGPFELMPGVHSTGPIDGLPPEQALVLETSQGLVMIVGCSHPGIVKMVETALKQRNKDSVRLLLGGFHLLKTEPDEIRKVVLRLDELKVKVVVPAHCTGEAATQMLQTTFGRHSAGAGRWIVMDGKRLEFRTVSLK